MIGYLSESELIGNNYLDEALENYLVYGLEPGGFLTSVLANDLRLAIGRADHWNRDNLPRIVEAITYSVPELAWGSYQRVRDWCKDKDSYRSKWVEFKREQLIIRKLENSH